MEVLHGPLEKDATAQQKKTLRSSICSHMACREKKPSPATQRLHNETERVGSRHLKMRREGWRSTLPPRG